jgi:hypothetical protein
MATIDPLEKKDFHAKIYIEESLADAIKNYQKHGNFFSFSEAGRKLLIDGLKLNGMF